MEKVKAFLRWLFVRAAPDAPLWLKDVTQQSDKIQCWRPDKRHPAYWILQIKQWIQAAMYRIARRIYGDESHIPIWVCLLIFAPARLLRRRDGTANTDANQ